MQILDDENFKKWAMHIATAILSFAVLMFLLDFRVYPYTDEWTYVVPLALKGSKAFWGWVFGQHVDHYIPLQKFLHFYVARASGYDFRYLVVINLVFVTLTTIILLQVARLYRGKTHWGDIIIPLVLLNPVSSCTMGAFQFTFLSSVFFISIFIYYALLFSSSKKIWHANIGLAALFFAALCGMNGVVFSLSISAGLIFWYFAWGKKIIFIPRSCIFSMALVVFVQFLVLYEWRPSSATDAGFELSEAWKFLGFLQASSMSIFAFKNFALKAFFFFMLFASAAAYCLKRLSNAGADMPALVLLLTILASEAVITSIAISRANAQGGWSNGLAMHYGFLTVFIPIVAWIVLSSALKGWQRKILSSVLVVIFILSYKGGFGWRANYAASILDRQLNITSALRSESNINSLAKKYTLDFTWQDNDNARRPVIRGIKILRQQGFAHYKLIEPESGFNR